MLCVAVLWLNHCRVLTIAEAIPTAGLPVPRLDLSIATISPAARLSRHKSTLVAIPDSNAMGEVASQDRSLLGKDIQANETSLAEPSSLPSAQPSVAPSTQPSSIPSLIPSSVPTVVPTWQPTAVPSAQPTASPSTVTFLPTSTPTSQPSSLPTLQPSARPSQQPTGQPTAAPSRFQAPSAQPTSMPSSQPSEQPSSLPSLQPFAAPTGMPSLQPTSVPSTQPSVQPSSWPSLQPSSHPTSRPSAQPSSQPTSLPTTAPSSMPSPAGEIGVTWWYLVTARCDLLASAPISQHNALEDVIYAFSLGLTDHLDNVERESVELTAVEISSDSTSSDSVGGVRRDASSTVDEARERRKLRTYPTILQHSSRGAYSVGGISSASTGNTIMGGGKTGGSVHSMLRGVVSMRKHHKQSDSYKKSYTIETWCADHPTAIKVSLCYFCVCSPAVCNSLYVRILLSYM